MNRTTKITAVILSAAFLGITGTYGYFSDTLRVTNHIALGDVNIGLKEFEKKGGREVTFENSKTILPGAVISKIPRITNYAMPCWIRARIIFSNENSETDGLDETLISGFPKNWIKRGEYYYYTQILKKKDSVDLFQTVSVPSAWTEEHSGQSLGLTVQAEAIQAANFQPDFEAMSPWGNQKIQQCVHEQDGNFACKAEPVKLSVEFNGKAHKLLAVPGDFFSNMGTAMPGDVFQDTVTVSNTTESQAEIWFRTAVSGQNTKQTEILKGVKLTVYLDKKQVYKGTLDSPELEKNHSLGIYQPGQKGELKFALEVPAEWDNAYALRDAAVQWIFTVNEDSGNASEEAGGGDSFTEASRKSTDTKEAAPVKTGDMSAYEGMTGILLSTGGIALAAGIYKKKRRGNS